MKYMLLYPASFALAAVFLNSFVGGEVTVIALEDDDYDDEDGSSYVGILSALVPLIAAIINLMLVYTPIGQISRRKSYFMLAGSLSYILAPLLFLVIPNLEKWNFAMIASLYCAMGVGRAVYEGPLRASFAVLFPSRDKEGAFVNLTLGYGSSSTAGFLLSIFLRCPSSSTSSYCVEYSDGTVHNVLVFEVIVIVVSLLGLMGYLMATHIHEHDVGSGDTVNNGRANDDERRQSFGTIAAHDSLSNALLLDEGGGDGKSSHCSV